MHAQNAIQRVMVVGILVACSAIAIVYFGKCRAKGIASPGVPVRCGAFASRFKSSVEYMAVGKEDGSYRTLSLRRMKNRAFLHAQKGSGGEQTSSIGTAAYDRAWVALTQGVTEITVEQDVSPLPVHHLLQWSDATAEHQIEWFDVIGGTSQNTRMVMELGVNAGVTNW